MKRGGSPAPPVSSARLRYASPPHPFPLPTVLYTYSLHLPLNQIPASGLSLRLGAWPRQGTRLVPPGPPPVPGHTRALCAHAPSHRDCQLSDRTVATVILGRSHAAYTPAHPCRIPGAMLPLHILEKPTATSQLSLNYVHSAPCHHTRVHVIRICPLHPSEGPTIATSLPCLSLLLRLWRLHRSQRAAATAFRNRDAPQRYTPEGTRGADPQM